MLCTVVRKTEVALAIFTTTYDVLRMIHMNSKCLKLLCFFVSILVKPTSLRIKELAKRINSKELVQKLHEYF
jgi:hypothetical protein